jgi:hypothetical protein
MRPNNRVNATVRPVTPLACAASRPSAPRVTQNVNPCFAFPPQGTNRHI